ncbi:hypothetical protein MUK42_08491 [Musa troglodytarum]|uniref:ALOG domain-containing protein n=1 Tax=Musa troglodytarum TaxID=320322 RepID=A0A9E7G611_9LILI|nr:hypothetical protein MUK42_08491 [Musa troglodytarum]
MGKEAATSVLRPLWAASASPVHKTTTFCCTYHFKGVNGKSFALLITEKGRNGKILELYSNGTQIIIFLGIQKKLDAQESSREGAIIVDKVTAASKSRRERSFDRSLMDFIPNPDSPHSDNSGGLNSSPQQVASSSTATSAGAPPSSSSPSLSRYESQKRRDWNTFGQYLKNHRPPLSLARCSGAHVLEFLRYLDQFGKTKVHTQMCPFFGHPNPPAPCPCPLRQAWGSLDALIGRLRAAYEENGGKPESNPFGARAVRLYLREVRDTQSKARGVSYEKKKRKKPPQHQQHPPPPPAAA